MSKTVAQLVGEYSNTVGRYGPDSPEVRRFRTIHGDNKELMKYADGLDRLKRRLGGKGMSATKEKTPVPATEPRTPFTYEPSGDSDGEYAGIDHFVLDTDGNEIACAPNEATARLLAASGELLAACQSVLEKLDYIQNLWGKEGVTNRMAEMLRAAVDKATVVTDKDDPSVTCPRCEGAGDVAIPTNRWDGFEDRETCPKCKGAKTVKDSELED